MEKEIKINLEAIRNQKIFIATPMYGGVNHGFYMKSMLDLHVLCQSYGIKLTFFSLFNESLITRARNYCVDEFLRSDCTYLLFIDSDIEFTPIDILALLHISLEDDDKHIIGAPYPKKNISWEKIKLAVDMGFAENNPFDLENYAGDYVFNPVAPGEFPIDSPIEVGEIGTGYMLIKREVFEKWDKERPEYLYFPDHVRMKNFDGERKIMAYFQDPIDPIQHRHLSEDYFFCQESRKMGMKVWICPWMKANHIGTYKFIGDLVSVARTGTSATADPELVKKGKQ